MLFNANEAWKSFGGQAWSAVVASLLVLPEEISLLGESIDDIFGGIYGEKAKVVIVQVSLSNAHSLLVGRRLD